MSNLLFSRHRESPQSPQEGNESIDIDIDIDNLVGGMPMVLVLSRFCFLALMGDNTIVQLGGFVV